MIKVVAQPGGSPQGVFFSNLLGVQMLWAQQDCQRFPRIPVNIQSFHFIFF